MQAGLSPSVRLYLRISMLVNLTRGFVLLGFVVLLLWELEIDSLALVSASAPIFASASASVVGFEVGIGGLFSLSLVLVFILVLVLIWLLVDSCSIAVIGNTVEFRLRLCTKLVVLLLLQW